MSITSKSTKAEILQAYLAIREQPTTAQDVWQWIAGTAQVVARETILLVKDFHKAGQVARSWYDQVIGELSRPVLKPRS